MAQLVSVVGCGWASAILQSDAQNCCEHSRYAWHVLTVLDGVLRATKWIAGKVLRVVPEWLRGRVLPGEFGFDPNNTPVPVSAPAGSVRLFIAPVNYAGQGWQWARAVERHLPDVGAVNMVCRIGNDFRHPADNVVPLGFYAASTRWQRTQRDAVLHGFTHVMIEAEKQPFGAVLDESIESQARDLIDAGVSVMMLCHGSDIRLPSRHMSRYSDSPFFDTMAPLAPKLERIASRNRAVLDRLGLPVFVTTPDLILDVPYARWLPSVVDLDLWRSDTAPLDRSRPIVAHAPSKGATKGSELVDPILYKLDAEGLITYRRVSKVPFSEMPEVYRDADIVIDQVRLGDYDVVALESMAAGRVLVGHVSDHTRQHVREQTGREVPVVEGRPDQLEATIRAIVRERDEYRNTALDGIQFVSEFHDGRRSAQILETVLR